MKLGIVALVSKQSPLDYNEQFCSFARYAVDEGFSVEFFSALNINADISPILQSNTEKIDALVFFGGDDFVKAALGILSGEYIVQSGNKYFAVLPEDEEWVDSFSNYLLPQLTGTGTGKTVYDELIIKTFGLTEFEVRDRIHEYMNYRKKLSITLKPSILECDVIIRYSTKIPKADFDYCVQGCISTLNDSVYGVGNTSLAECVVRELQDRGGRLAIAESFTGGAVCSSLVQISGASTVLTEGVVAYSDQSKILRLNVDSSIIERNGAVSNETAYCMATGLFDLNQDIDFVCATTGFAGPDGRNVGLLYVATGDKNNIHLRKYNTEGSRSEIIEYGVKRALMDLLWLIRNKSY